MTKALGDSFEEAASICLARHHAPPRPLTLIDNGQIYERSVDWPEPDERTRAAWANATDATEAGAYALALAAIDETRGLVAIARAETLTGADYYLGTAGRFEDLESAYRLEVSGTDSANAPDISCRLRRKKAQTKAGSGNLPAVVSVVSFGLPRVLTEDVD